MIYLKSKYMCTPAVLTNEDSEGTPPDRPDRPGQGGGDNGKN